VTDMLDGRTHRQPWVLQVLRLPNSVPFGVVGVVGTHYVRSAGIRLVVEVLCFELWQTQAR
jgi:hypothetical protein